MYIWSTEISNLYIGQYPSGWEPWENTVAYYPLNWDINDYSWNNRNLSVEFGTVSYTTLSSWIQVFSPRWTGITSWGTWLSYSDSVWDFTWDFTINFFVKLLQTYNNYMSFVTNRHLYTYRWMNSIDSSNEFFFHWEPQYKSWWIIDTNVWHNICCTVISGTYYIYVDNTLKKSGSYTYWIGTPWRLNIWFWYTWAGGQNREPLNWDISNVIIEDKWWTAQEVSDYYNLTKSLYGIS